MIVWLAGLYCCKQKAGSMEAYESASTGKLCNTLASIMVWMAALYCHQQADGIQVWVLTSKAGQA
jgi:hypothetical protein